ncbi:hypothetical protein BKA70DRAFT_1255360 [Coprinopsis sp. MPI-PUGE-AT-0042]|nr:hypothetical protein BKA70DRAFT_1255360 [Coprinopsis sp. MPI-PUGE-AT-0042]
MAEGGPGPRAFPGASNFQLNGSTVNNVGGNIYNNIHHTYSPIPHIILPADERVQIANWFSPVSFRAYLVDNLEWRTPDTRVDYIKSDYFLEWLESNGGAIWGTGMPGAGKTTLASIVTEILEEREKLSPAGTISVSFIYCRYTERLSLREVLAAVVKQNLLKHPKLLSLARPIYERHIGEGTAPTRHELTTLLMEFTKHFRVNFYSLDGLDEALEEVRSDLLRVLSSLPVNLMVTSRPLKGLEYLVPKARHFYIVALKDDLRLMIIQKVEHNAELRDVVERKPELLDELTSLIYEKAGGMFLHAYLQVQALDGCTTVREVRAAVDAFPHTIEAMYSLSVKRIKEQKGPQAALALRILHWLVYANEGLTVEDMQYALAASVDTDNYQYADDNVPHENSIVSVCCGLVTIQPASRRVRLVHYTARDALRALWREMYPSNPNPHSLLASVCVGRLIANGFHSRPDLVDYGQLEEEFKEHRFLRYAYFNFWPVHARPCLEGHNDPAEASIRYFVQSFHAYPHSLETAVDHFQPIHIAARYNLIGLLPKPLDPQSYCISTRLGQNALTLACRGDHYLLVEELLTRGGIDINAQDNYGHTALIWASLRGYERIVAKLLQYSELNVNAVTSDGHSAFSYACDRGHVAVMDLLLQHPHIAISHQDPSGQTPLMLALWKGENGDDVVDRLLQHLRTAGGGPAQPTWPGYRELKLAVIQGDEGLVYRLFKEFDIDINWVDDQGHSLRDLAQDWEVVNQAIASATSDRARIAPP